MHMHSPSDPARARRPRTLRSGCCSATVFALRAERRWSTR